MQHSQRYQHFALDVNNDIIDIHNADSSCEQRYFCPHCHNEMIAKRGNIRQWHFAHKTDKCSYDSYLHSIAEKMIMNWFNQKESIILEMDAYKKCSKYDNCIFRMDEYCTGKTTIRYNLKEYYSKCTQERGYEGFVADLFCESEGKPNSPIFIEIFVTHECSQEKKDSGIRIIEFHIQSEEDILHIINSTQITEGNMVRLYNFKRKTFKKDDFIQPFQKYMLYPTLKSFVDKERYTCRNYNLSHRGIYEISMPYDDCIPYFLNSGGLYTVGKVKAYQDGYLKKDCQICRWQSSDWTGDNFCKLYKKCGNPKYCKDNDASKCAMFGEDREMIQRVISDFNDYMKENHVDVWKGEVLDAPKNV